MRATVIAAICGFACLAVSACGGGHSNPFGGGSSASSSTGSVGNAGSVGNFGIITTVHPFSGSPKKK
jgi:hypothetical protein